MSKEYKMHGGKGEKLYEVWCSMKQRCNCSTNKYYKYYGMRGISVCDEWNHNYSAFKEWALLNGYEEGLSIDRINNDGNYEPKNCRWATRKIQANNQRTTLLITYKGTTHTLHEWADFLNINSFTLYNRIYINNWDIERALFEKVSLNRYNRKILNETYIKERENNGK